MSLAKAQRLAALSDEELIAEASDAVSYKQRIRDLVTECLDSHNFWEAFDNLINGLGAITGDDFFDDDGEVTP